MARPSAQGAKAGGLAGGSAGGLAGGRGIRGAARRLDVRGWSLRTRIVAVLALTVILLSTAIAAIALTTLRASLVRQLDGDLRMLTTRVAAPDGPGAPDGAGAPPGSESGDGAYGGAASGMDRALDGPGVMADSVVIVGSGGDYRGSLLDEDFAVQRVSDGLVQRIVEHRGAGPGHEIDLGSDLGRYRFMSLQHGPETVIVGLPLRGVEQTVSTVALTMGGVAVGGCLLLGALAAWYIRREMRPLERVADTAEGIAETPLDRGEVELASVEAPGPGAAREVDRLVSGFNAMIDQVGRAFRARQESEEKVRRFVADASHELRTPLASIRGYSEFTRRLADDIPADAAYALTRIESESVRMSELVEGLLLLARLDEGAELAVDDVDLAHLVADAVNDARVAGPDHVWRLECPPDPVTVRGDAGRLHQVLVNLLANARLHTPAGTEVTVALREDAERAVIVVADDGPGIPAAEIPHLFERFVRGDASRTRSTGSTGLGLAIVEAIVAGHGGAVRVTSEPGDTRFVVELPRAGGAPVAG